MITLESWNDQTGLGKERGVGNLALKLKTRFPKQAAPHRLSPNKILVMMKVLVGHLLGRFTRQEVLCCSEFTFMKHKGHCAGRQHKQKGGLLQCIMQPNRTQYFPQVAVLPQALTSKQMIPNNIGQILLDRGGTVHSPMQDAQPIEVAESEGQLNVQYLNNMSCASKFFPC